MTSIAQKKSYRLNEQGMALLITIMTVSLLIAVTMQFHKTTWQQFVVADNYQAATQLETIAASGINIAAALLENDGAENSTDSLFEPWAMLDKEKIDEVFPSGSLQLQVVDLSGRLQINSLVQQNESTDGAAAGANTEGEGANIEGGGRQLFLNLLLSKTIGIEDETEARTLLDAIIDWLDTDDKESDLGAESSYYQTLDKPYSCRNGPIQYLEELLLIKGMTPELLFGTAERSGLARYLTVNGDDGKVNINTAPLPVIKSFDPQIGDELLEKFDTYRKDKDHEENLAKPDWFREVDGWPGDIVLQEQLMTVTSSYFQIIATGKLASLSRTVQVVAERSDDGEIKLFGRKMAMVP